LKSHVISWRGAIWAVPVAGLIALVSNASAAAAFDLYVSGSSGYDVSYLQCGSATPSGTFGIVGLNAGYPFTYYNGCLATEFAAAQRTGNAALYINTGYDPTYTAVDGIHSTQDCVTKSAGINATLDQQSAWAVGCSEAERDIAYASTQSASSSSAWWLDVETANSWSTTDLSLNRYTLQGIIDTLRATVTSPIGIYSTPSQWTTITGGYQAPADADWVATGVRSLKRAKQDCGPTGFSGSPIWLVQYLGTTDRDYAC